MCNCKKICRENVDFNSPKLSLAINTVKHDLDIISQRLCEPLESLQDAFDLGKLLIGIFTTPCGKSLVFVEHNERQLITPLREIH